MMRQRILALVIGLLCASPLFAATPATTPEIPASGFDALAPLLDTHDWMLVQARGVQLGTDGAYATAQLFKSIRPTGIDGVGRDMHSVNLVVAVNGRPRYSFAPAAVSPSDRFRADPIFYMDDRDVDGGPLEVRDVTGDGVSEILFHSGIAGASDWGVDVHVLHYGADGALRDVRDPHFKESWWHRFRWLTVGGGTVGIAADPIEPSDPDASCHGCPKYHRYLVYRWDEHAGAFALVQTIPSTGVLHGSDADPMQVDRTYIGAAVSKMAAEASGPSPPGTSRSD